MSDSGQIRVLTIAAVLILVLGIASMVAGSVYDLNSLTLLSYFQLLIVGVIALILYIQVMERDIHALELKQEKLSGEMPDEALGDFSEEVDSLSSSLSKVKQTLVDWQKQSKDYMSLYLPIYLIIVSVLCFVFSVSVFVPVPFISGLVNIRLAESQVSIVVGIACIVVSFVYLVGGNWFGLSSFPFKVTLTSLLRSAQVLSFVTGVVVALESLGVQWLDQYVSYVIFLFMCLVIGEIILRCGNKLLFSGDEFISLDFVEVLLSGKNPVTMLLDSLENNTGISLRSAWTISFVRKTLPGLMVVAAVFFWLMTSLVQVNPQEGGIVYRFGQMQPGSLEPGLHFKLPWPMETVKLYPVHEVQSFAVGFESSEDVTDYLWTRGHGGDEYKMLLGDGNELVSINMIVYFEIEDIFAYARGSSSPEEELQAHAYRLLLRETVSTNLDNLLTRDRKQLARNLQLGLQEVSVAQGLGLRVTDVSLASIHPPVEIAQEYQEIVSAETYKQVIVNEALAAAIKGRTLGEAEKAEIIRDAEIEAAERLAEAYEEIGLYLYQLKAYLEHPEAYRQWKWLEAFERGLDGKIIYLLDEKANVQTDGLWLDMRTTPGGVDNDE